MTKLEIDQKKNLIIQSNVVKVSSLIQINPSATYFFRESAIPFNRLKSNDINYFKHIGVYAFRKSAFLRFF